MAIPIIKMKRWHIVALIITLLVCSVIIGSELKEINLKGIECLKKPACPISLYQQNIEVEKVQAEFKESLERLGVKG